MKLSQYAKKVGITYRTAWFWYKDGQIKGYQMPTGTIVITEDQATAKAEKVAIYARVSSSEHKSNLETQADRLAAYCAAKGWQVQMVIKEVGSGVNDSRDKLLKLLADTSITVIVVEHKDRLTRFGFNYIATLLESQGRRIEVVNLANNHKEDLLGDLTSIIYSFCARLYGQRRAKRKTEQITKQLEENGDATC
jgi:predicted site-specific integrase-resolvase